MIKQIYHNDESSFKYPPRGISAKVAIHLKKIIKIIFGKYFKKKMAKGFLTEGSFVNQTIPNQF